MCIVHFSEDSTGSLIGHVVVSAEAKECYGGLWAVFEVVGEFGERIDDDATEINFDGSIWNLHSRQAIFLRLGYLKCSVFLCTYVHY